MLLLSLLLATEPECLSCCEEAGESCSAELRVMASDASPSQDGWVGSWVVGCDGSAVYDPSTVLHFDARPLPGQVSTEGVPKVQLKCFVQACSFPEDLCPEAVDGLPVLGHCETEAPFRDSDLRPPAAVVVSRGSGPTVHFAGADVPEPPATACSATGEVKRQARVLVNEGNDLEIAGDLEGARARYLAAISLHPCNTLAWSSLGLLAERQQDHEGAVRALTWVVEQEPAHYGAWTALGQAQEALGQPDEARTAYQRALRLRPGHKPAEQGLQRLR